MNPDDFLKTYEAATNSHDFDNVAPLIDKDAVYWFSDGSFEGIEAIREAFIATWTKIKDEKYSINNVRWFTSSDDTAVCVYDFSWQGSVDGVQKSGSGRGTNVLVHKSGGWLMLHEHLSTEKNQL
jgi:ketosteroid isomerase-like protein